MTEGPRVVGNLGIDRGAQGVYIGRAWAGRLQSEWANPFRVGDDTPTNRREAVWKYFVWLMASDLRLRIHELRDKQLLCWCHPALCHGHVLAWIIANQEFHAAPCPRCGGPLESRMNYHHSPATKATKEWNLLYEQGPCPSCRYYRFRHAVADFGVHTIEEWAKVNT